MSIQVAKAALAQAVEILGERYGKPEAQVMVLAIGGQETKYLARRQIIKKNGKLVPEGPATGFWQFELGGGVTGVMTHPASKALAQRLCEARAVPFNREAVWAQLQYDDVLAAGFARLLLLTDPRPLPKIGDSEPAWQCYIRNWRPGKPHPETWATAYLEALKAVGV